MKKLNWIESGGGPLLLASESQVTKWLGTQASELVSDLTDYQRACAVQDEIDVISLGPVQAVVLGDEPDRTALFEDSSDILILRWRWAESEESLLLALHSDLSRLSFARSGKFSTIAGEHLLFDSAYAGVDIAKSLGVRLNASEYTLETIKFNPSKHVCAIIHRLRPTEN